MRVIGVTGGVGAGKSLILDFLREKYGAYIIKTDLLAKELMEYDPKLKGELRKLFAPRQIFDEKGILLRQEIAKCIFQSPSLREEMNSLVHPRVKQAVIAAIDGERRKKETAYFVVEAALLIEDHYDLICDELWYIYASENVRRERLITSRNYSEEKIQAIFSSQLSEEIFRKHCREVIDNSGSYEESFAQIQRILEERSREDGLA